MTSPGATLHPATDHLWQEQLRQHPGGDALVHVLTDIRDSQHSMALRMDSLEQAIPAALKEHSDTAFPSGDADGHRRAHQTMISMVEEKRKLRMAIQEKTLSGLAWSAIVALGVAAWNIAKEHLK